MEVVTEKTAKKSVPEGYKKTELGVVPLDWELVPIGDYANITGGYAFKSCKFRDDGKYQVVKMGNVYMNRFDLDRSKSFLDKINSKEKAYLLKKGDIIISLTGTVGKQDYGYSIRLKRNGNLLLNQRLARLRANESLNDVYLDNQLKSQSFLKQFYDLGKGGTGNQTNVSITNLSKLKIPTPPTVEEQQAIAEALSDVDTLIAELDALIEKKQQVKKGAMQQLLTGKKRLPGFDGEWEEKTLEEIGNTYNGLSGKSGADFGNGNRPYIPFLNVMNNPVIDTSKFDTVKIKPGESQSAAEKGDLFFNTSSETPEEVGMCSVLLEDIKNLHLNSFCFGFRLFDEKKTYPLFLAYYFRSQYGREHMKSLAQGSTRYNLSKSKFIKIKVALPSYEEQKAIACILSDMDAEIQTLLAKRTKYEKIKQGMMQELLTGKTRLVDASQKHEQKGSEERKRNWVFEEAVIISTLIDHFSTEDFFPNRFRYVKYSYLLKRFNEMGVKRYLKKAAGPYNPQTRYGGPERIAKEKGYIIPASSDKFEGFRPGDNVEEAIGYFKDWYGTEVLDWLEQFRYTKSNKLELWTTVDKAILELNKVGKDTTLENVKNVIGSHPEWKPKLDRDLFSDENIESAIKKSFELFKWNSHHSP